MKKIKNKHQCNTPLRIYVEKEANYDVFFAARGSRDRGGNGTDSHRPASLLRYYYHVDDDAVKALRAAAAAKVNNTILDGRDRGGLPIIPSIHRCKKKKKKKIEMK